MKHAIVLSGGGAKGAYQVGVLKALNKINYQYDIVTGCSVGALNGIFFTTKEVRKLEKLWKNVKYDHIYGKGFEKEMLKKGFLLKQTKEIIKNKGMDISALEKLFIKNINIKKFYNSSIDYGLVTFCIDNLKPLYICKKDLNKSNIQDYVLASASIFPAFQMRKINNKKYVDGGYYDQVPIELAKQMGASDILVVDLKAIGNVRKKPSDVQITTISPRNKLCKILTFDKKEARMAIKYGYNDTLKVLNKLGGNKYTFKEDTINKLYNEYSNKMIDIVKIHFKDKNITNIILEDKTISKILSNKKFLKEFLDVIENLLYILEIDDTKIYSKSQINYLIKKKFKKTKNKVLLSIYTNINNKRKIKKLASLYPKEYMAVIYIYLLNSKVK